MNIHLNFRNPTPMHCDVAIFVNDALAGTIRLRQSELVSFQQIVAHGCSPTLDSFRATGNPNHPDMQEPT